MSVAQPKPIEIELRPHQRRALESRKRNVAAVCGVGAGKTYVSGLWVPQKVAEADHWPRHMAQGMICANTYPQLYDSTLRRMFAVWDQFGIPYRPATLPKSYSPLTVSIFHRGEWREILCRSLDSPNTLSGLEVGFLAADEVWDTDHEAIAIVEARVRAKAQPLNQSLYTTTADDPTTWLYDFVTKTPEHLIEVIYATTYDNLPNLPEGYIEHLKSIYTDSEFERMVMAKWVSITEGRVYPQFDRSIHIQPTPFDPGLPIHWWHDFNFSPSAPLSSVLVQFWPGPDRGSPTFAAFDEIILPGADLEQACDEIEARYGDLVDLMDPNRVVICGDATARKSQKSNLSDYGYLRSRGYTNQEVPGKNPPVKSRIESVRRVLRPADNSCRFRCDKKCATLAKGLETVSYKPGAQGVEKQTYEQHVTSALGYGIHVYAPPPGRVAEVQSEAFSVI